MAIRLFIENQEVEIDESVQFAITKQFEDISNPTDIINDWSKTVSIPFTQNNNELFGHIYNPDKVIVDGGTIGVYFNPLRKLDFRLEWNNAILMSGYAKMNEVKQVNGNGTYEITLFGQLGKVFQEMQKITFDTTSDLTDYIIDGGQYVDEYISKDLIYQSWTSTGQTYEKLFTKYLEVPGGSIISHPAYSVTDIIGFAPNNSFSENFEYTTVQRGDKYTDTFSNILGNSFASETGIKAETVISDGLLPREYGEYRSYLQLPYIYWNKLFQVFQYKAESITGYKFELDDTWFNTSNPYWHNLVYMLNGFSYFSENIETNKYKLGWSNNGNLYWGSAAYTQNKSADIPVTYHIEGSGIGHMVYDMEELVPIYDTTNSVWSSSIYGIHINIIFDVNIKYLQFYKDNSYWETKLGTNNGLKLKFSLIESGTSSEINDYTVFICASNFSGTVPTVNAVINVDTLSTSSVISGDHYSSIPFSIPVYLYLPPNTTASLRISGGWLNQNVPFVMSDGSSTSGTSPIYLPTIYLNNTPSYKDFTLTDSKRSFSRFTLNDLWNKDFNLFEEVLKYCKMYRIIIYTDEINKKIIFKPFTKFFENYTISDWTDKIDKSRDFIITPITFANKYVLFNYNDSETSLCKTYKEKYGLNIGEYRLITAYNFNIETKELFKNIMPSIVNTDNVLPWESLKQHRIIYSFPSEIYVYNKDKDRKQVNIFGSWYFHNGLQTFDTDDTLNLTSPSISDDSKLQQNISTYFYNALSNDKISCPTYPNLDIVMNDNLCVFNIPKENYTYLENYTDKNSIYTNFWVNYINERYNIQNKMITCYVDIKPIDFNRFNFNHLIKVGNQLCIVNKIYDYDVTSNETTKVDLVTIQDISGYTSNNYTV